VFAYGCYDLPLRKDLQRGINVIQKVKTPNRGKSVDILQKLLKRYGKKAAEQARKCILDELFQDKVVSDALRYFVCNYWKDYATPTLLSLSYEAVRGDSKSLVDIAPSLILINGAVDIHDDIVDHSMQKDGRLTVYGKFGKEVALLVGDALLIKGFLMLTMACRRLDGEKREEIMNVLKQGLFEIGEAEVTELRCRGATGIKPKDYLKIMRKKAADVEALMRLGAMLANAKKSEVEALGEYGRILGLISILRDDIIDMTLQEELRHRLEYECLPLPLLYALQDAELHAELLKLISNRIKTRSEYTRVLSLAAQGLEKAANYINELAVEGKSSTLNVKGPTQDLQSILTGLADLKECGIS
jgi:geranylgeranyl pyrophosphate synthase